jgi:hypothetical protein
LTGSVYDTAIMGIQVKCLAPGEHGYLNAIKNLPAPISMSSLTAADIVFSASTDAGAMPAKDPPKIVSAQVVQGGLGTSRVEGDVQIGNAAISSISVLVYVKSPEGLIADQLLANAGSQAPNSVWHYSAGIFDGLVMTHVDVLDFRTQF